MDLIGVLTGMAAYTESFVIFASLSSLFCMIAIYILFKVLQKEGFSPWVFILVGMGVILFVQILNITFYFGSQVSEGLSNEAIVQLYMAVGIMYFILGFAGILLQKKMIVKWK